MHSFVFPNTRPVHVTMPEVVRYMDKEFVDEFFNSGKLRLTTFEHCAAHPDKTREDSNEGVTPYLAKGEHVTGNGTDVITNKNYMFCTSLIESNRLKDRFSTDGHFVITDVMSFFNAVAKQLAGFEEGMLGACIYKDEKIISGPLPNTIFREEDRLAAVREMQSKNDEGPMQEYMDQNMNNMSVSIQKLMNEAYFLKETAYYHEAEFRMVWRLDHIVERTIDIKVPEAIQYCRHGDPKFISTNQYGKPEYAGMVIVSGNGNGS
jgi:hypothetical protein